MVELVMARNLGGEALKFAPSLPLAQPLDGLVACIRRGHGATLPQPRVQRQSGSGPVSIVYCDWAKPNGGRPLGLDAVGTSSPGARGAGSSSGDGRPGAGCCGVGFF